MAAQAQITVLRVLLAALLSLPVGVQAAQAQFRLQTGAKPAEIQTADQAVQVRLAGDAPSIGPGQTIRLAVIFTIAPYWHIYWLNPGDSGAPTNLTVTAPEGFSVGGTLFPRPGAFEETAGTVYGYERQTVLFVPVTAPKDLKDGEASFQVDIFYLVCRDRCLIGRAAESLRIATTSGAAGPEPSTPDAQTLRRHADRLPRPLAELAGASARLEGGLLLVTGPAGGHETIEFFPLPVPGVTFGEAEIVVEDDRFRLAVPFEVKPQNALGQKMSVRGVLGLGRSVSDPCYDLLLPLESDAPPTGAVPSGAGGPERSP
jgi:DsbC/DsbD-like thiol-disulfide interchange protein